uniref:diacylglycerol O-acyltransferase n=1 Tax=Strigamia maritima TaxID=126957 RepID=T1IIH5_STRMM
MEQMKNAVKSKWTDVNDKQDQYKHPRLRKHVADSCGYFYWLIDKNFSIDDHIQIYDCKPPKNQNQLDDLCSQISSQPLPKNQSPWLILLFPLDESFGNNEPRYVVFFRFHHCLGDGYNLNRMISNCFLDEKYLNFLKAKSEKKISITTLLTTFFYYPKFLVDCCLSKDNNILHGPPQTGKRFLQQVSLYSLPRVKKIAKATGATINDVMVSCIAGALKKYFSKNNAPPLKDVHCYVPVLLQSASEEAGFKNNTSMSLLPLALSDATGLGRLKSTQKATSLGFIVSSFIGKMQLTVSADEAIMEKKDVDTIVMTFFEEFEELENSITI